MVKLYDLDRHIRIKANKYPATERKTVLKQIVDDHLRFADSLKWPRSSREDTSSELDNLRSLYWGSTGIIWALESLKLDKPFLERPYSRNSNQELSLPEVEGIGINSFFMSDVALELINAKKNSSYIPAELAMANSPADLFFGLAGSLLYYFHAYKITGLEDFAEKFREYLGVAAENNYLNNYVFEWKSKPYRLVGAAHGLVGLLGVILRAREFIPKKHFSMADRLSHDLIRSAISDVKYSNWPFEFGDVDCERIYFCHGATGVIAMLSNCVSRERGSIKILESAGSLVYEAGAVSKGVSLCHGTSGSAYALLQIHKLTGESKWLDRAIELSNVAISQYKDSSERRYSLFTGDTGLMVLLTSLENGNYGFPVLDYF
ncbi:MAG: hypothetical protein HRU19_16480 [Pseudobacteriovorax sp.]|nr:hypothetical protein [Pseudobacteriovorax sp.]